MDTQPKPARSRARPSAAVQPVAADTTTAAEPEEKTLVRVIERGELGEFVKATTKLHGPNVIRAAELRPQFRHTPTNIFSLDLALHGGIVEGAMTLVYGRPASAKTTLCKRTLASAQAKYPNQATVFVDIEGCIAADSLLVDAVDGRVMTAQEVFKTKAPLRTLSYDVTTKTLRAMPFTDWFDNGVKPVFRVETSSTQVEATGNHRFLVMADGLHEPRWVRADQLRAGMHIARPRRQAHVWGETPVSADEARWVGYMLGDGDLRRSGSFVFTNTDNDIIEDMGDVTSRLGAHMARFSDRHFRVYGHLGGAKSSRWDRSPVRVLADRLAITGSKSWNKSIPHAIMAGSENACREALSGLYLTDGTVHGARPTLAFSTTSRTLAEQVRLLWSRFGVVARISSIDYASEHHRRGYMVSINGLSRLAICNRVLRLVGAKAVALARWTTVKERRPQRSTEQVLPAYFNNNLRLRARFLRLYRNDHDVWWDEITKVMPAGEKQTYDFTVLGTHNFTVNDVVAHNTYHPEWGEAHGIDNSRMLLIQPESGEQALDLARGAVKSNEVSCLVVDSLAALTPMKELDKSMEDATVGEAAKMMARFCRVISSDLLNERKRAHRPSLMIINQWRQKIGVMYGSPNILPGGDAQHFTAVTKIEMKNKEIMGKDSQGREIVSYNQHSFRVDKSKIGVGFREGEFEMIRDPSHKYGAGFIDEAKTVVTWARGTGAITGGGNSWHVRGIDRRFGRLQDIADHFYEADPEFYADFKMGLIRDYREFCKLKPEYL